MDCAFLEKWLINGHDVETVCLLSRETGRHAKDYIKVGIDAEEYYAIKNASRD